MPTSGPVTEIRDRNVLIVVFGIELKQIDELNVFELGETLFKIAEKLPQPLLVLDMSVTEFFGSSFIEVLFRTWKRLAMKPGAQLALAGIQPFCREVLQVTHLDTLWPMYDSHQTASDALNDTVAAG